VERAPAPDATNSCAAVILAAVAAGNALLGRLRPGRPSVWCSKPTTARSL